ncbi:hypothetical protein [Cochlodiniinecator piscidefendens]|uniref:hypothetical protein n=1 Tax=Cochlodiniinecator piscidefendens TaxID=2715756 RepID=UPI00140B1AAB|nr:hypothetical protein [Cochlodiniinecator piscidefendens]
MSDVKQQLKRALDTALAQYTETMGEAFPIAPILDVVDDPEFWAMAEMDGDIFRIRVSTGTADGTAKLWTSAFNDEGFVASFGQAIGTDARAMTHIGLVWLMLHELHHFQMGHFDNQHEPNLSMTGSNKEHGLVKRTAEHSETHPSASAASGLIFEMQADHDATEMLLDAYSPDEWLSLRARIAAISAMMMLIERADSSNYPHGATHPKAATRMFQLLGHVIDMPTLSAHPNLQDATNGEGYSAEAVSEEETTRFVTQVAVPAFFDAVSLARVVSAQSIIDDLGDAGEFFSDIQTTKLDVNPDNLNTIGARELITLKHKMHSQPDKSSRWASKFFSPIDT